MWMQTGGDQPSKGLAGSSKGVDANTQSRTARQLTGKEFPDDERIQKGKTIKREVQRQREDSLAREERLRKGP